jgi:membrane associated rhomboid family serine protease
MLDPTQGKIPPAIRNLLIANVAIYVLQIIPPVGRYVTGLGALIPSTVFLRAHVWRLVTYAFLHAPQAPFHLLFNMLVLWMFGVEIEHMWGSKRFTIFYFIGCVGAGLFSVLMWNTPIIGASGAVLALLTVYAFYFPHRRILLFFLFPVPVRVAVMIFGFISVIGSLGSMGGIAHLTHLGGIAVGLIYMKTYDPIARWFAELRARENELKSRKRAEEQVKEQRRFEEVIDPILKKISREGMASLTPQERKMLNEASADQKRRINRSKVVPFRRDRRDS